MHLRGRDVAPLLSVSGACVKPTRFLYVTGIIGAVYVALTIYSTVLGGPHLLPIHLNSAFFALLVASFVWGLRQEGRAEMAQLHQETRAEMERRHQETRDHFDARLDSITNQHVEHNIRLEEITGEIPKVRPIVTACHHVGLDSNVVELGRRISGQLRAPSMRHDD